MNACANPLLANGCCLQAVTNDLERFKEQLTAAQTAADAAAKKQTAADGAARRAAARQQQEVAAASEAAVAIAGLLLSCVAVMSGAAAVMQQHAKAAAAAAAPDGGQSNSSSNKTAAAAAAAVVASGLADMVCLSQDELADLLGCEDETCQLLLAAAPHSDGDAAAAAGSAAADGIAGAAGTAGYAASATPAVQRLLQEHEACYMQQQRLLHRQLEDALLQLTKSSCGGDASSDALRSSSSSSHGAGDDRHWLAAAAAGDAGVGGSLAQLGQLSGAEGVTARGAAKVQGGPGGALQPVLAALQLEAAAVQGMLRTAVLTLHVC
jgi:hypothetical protein